MTNPFPTEDHDLEAAIAKAHSELSTFSAETKEYQAAVDQLSKLYKLKTDMFQHFHDAEMSEAKQQLESDKNAWAEEQDQRPFYKRVSPDTALTVAGNLLIGLAVIKYEQTGVIGTKVMSFMRKI